MTKSDDNFQVYYVRDITTAARMLASGHPCHVRPVSANVAWFGFGDTLEFRRDFEAMLSGNLSISMVSEDQAVHTVRTALRDALAAVAKDPTLISQW